MQSIKKYKVAVVILAVLVFTQTLLLFFFWRKAVRKAPAPLAIKGKIAIVLDDWGYNLNNLSILSEIKHPLTLSVLPNLHYSSAIAKEAQRNGREVILHLPMEPHENYNLEKDTVTTSMSEQAIKAVINQDLASVPYVKGVSNHMGSKATEDVRTMTVVFKQLKRRKLYFLDSFVSSESICLDLAHKMHIGFARRDVFLDNQRDPDYIRGQLNKLKIRARFYGQAVGIGHDRKITLETLREVLPQLSREGYDLVLVSELFR